MTGERRGDTEIISANRHGEGKSNKGRILTIKIELHKVNPYQILWIGERPFDRRGQEDTFVRFTIDSKGKVVGGFSHIQKKFVIPKVGTTPYRSGTEESRFGANGDPEQSAGEFP